MSPFVDSADALFADLIGPLKPPRHPILAARFGLRAIQPATRLAARWFTAEPARALIAGLAAHSILPLEYWATSAVGLVLGLAGHAEGWPVVRGGSHRLSEAMASYFRSLGGEIITGWRVESLDELPASSAVLLDVTPRQVIRIAGHRLPPGYVRRLGRFRYGAGVYKLDWALSGPIPWSAPECARAGTVHLGGTLAEVAASESAIGRGEHPPRPFVLLSQPSLFDASRCPPGHHTAWAYCHVPNGSTVDMSDRIEDQVERFAPGFRDLILARHAMAPVRLRDLQRQLHRRRHQRRRPGPAPVIYPPCGSPRPLLHPIARPLHLLFLDAARRRCPWPLRLSRRQGRIENLYEKRVGTQAAPGGS